MPSLYILKAISAIFIVFIHLPGIWIESTILQPLMRIGVPCFLMISGYFLVVNGEIKKKNAIKQLKKTILLTIAIYGIYILFHIIRNLLLGNPAIPDRWLNLRFLWRLLLVGDNIDSVFWYLTAYMEALIIIIALTTLFSQNITKKILAIASPILLILAVIFNRYSGLLGLTLDIATSRNALTVALPCLFLGASIKLYSSFYSKLNIHLKLIAILVILSYGEYLLLHKFDINGSGADYNILTFPLSFSIFLYCIKIPNLTIVNDKISNGLVSIGKNYSANLYLYHSLVWGIITLTLMISGFDWFKIFMNGESVIILIILFSYLSKKIKEKNGFK